jgi:hypothetical protein
MTGTSPPGAARTGPWTHRHCVTAACTRCGTIPADNDTGLTPHFAGTGQAREELPRDWGWQLTPAPGTPDDDQLLCPACATAADSIPAPPAPETAGSPQTAPWWETAGQPGAGLPPNAAVLPAARPGGQRS